MKRRKSTVIILLKGKVTSPGARSNEFEQIIETPTVNLSAPGTNATPVEVTHISNHGVWLLAGEHELFMPYDSFPWFKDVPVGKILNVEGPTPGHYYWPDLDIDLTEEIISHPERFPRQAR